MKLNRNSKEWKEAYNYILITFCLDRGTEKLVGYEDAVDGSGPCAPLMEDAMPDRIKEAEEYADHLFSAMR